MQNVASDPVVARPWRPDPAPSRADTPGPSGAFDAMLDSTAAEAPRPAHADQPPRAERRDPVSDDRGDTRSEASQARDPADRPAAPKEAASTDSAVSAKSADAPTTRQVKDGQTSDSGAPVAGKAEADGKIVVAQIVPDIAVTADPVVLVAAVASATPAVAKDEPEAKGAVTKPAPKTDDDTSAPAPDAKPADVAAAAAIAVAVAAPVPAVPVPVAGQTEAPANVAPVGADAAAAAPVVPADLLAAAAAAAATPETKSVDGKNAAPKSATAPDAPAEAAPKAASTDEPLKVVAPEALVVTPDTKPIAGQKIDSAKGKSDHERVGRVASDARAPEETHVAAAEIPPEPQARSTAPHQPRTPATELAAAIRTPSAEARGDAAATQAVAALSNATNNAPIPPFGLAVSPSLPAPSLWPATALRIDNADSAVPVAGLAVEIVSRAQDGLKRFDIRLDPPELGRIDVRLDVDQAGKVTSRLTVDRVETLDLLRRDAPQLERALQHAGLNTDGGLQFSLRDQSLAHRDQAPGGNTSTSHLIIPEDEPAAAEAARRGYGRLIGLGGGVDIRV